MDTQVSGGDIPHLLFYGPSGAGKRTRMMAALRELYGPSIDKVPASMLLGLTVAAAYLIIRVS